MKKTFTVVLDDYADTFTLETEIREALERDNIKVVSVKSDEEEK